MRVAIVHDDLMQWGGAERVLEGICEIYPDAPIFTSVFDLNNEQLFKRFGSKKVITSFLQKIPGWKTFYKIMLPFYPIAFEQFNFDEFDLVISHTTRFAKSIITKPATKHISYCHTPPRFLWHFSGMKNYGFGEFLMTKLRIYDQVSVHRVDHFIAGSENAKRRIKKIYGVDSKVVYPFINLKRFENVDTFDGGYFVVAGRLNEYKRFDLAKEACSKIGVELKVLDGSFNDDMVVEILRGSKGLIIPGIEDFGLVSIEAQALGKGVVAFKDGGALETVIEGNTGIFFEKQTVESLVVALQNFKSPNKQSFSPNKDMCIKNAKRFSTERFRSQFIQTIDSL